MKPEQLAPILWRAYLEELSNQGWCGDLPCWESFKNHKDRQREYNSFLAMAAKAIEILEK